VQLTIRNLAQPWKLAMENGSQRQTTKQPNQQPNSQTTNRKATQRNVSPAQTRPTALLSICY